MVWEPSQVSVLIWVRNYTGLVNRKKCPRRKSMELQWFGSPRRYPCSFEQGITMVWRTVRSVLVEKAKITMVWEPSQVSMFIWARNYNGLACRKKCLRWKSKELHWFGSRRRYPCSFEQGITIVWRTVRSIFVEKARNDNSLGALAGIHVHLSKELHWFGVP